MKGRWAVVGVPDRVSNGGELRASHLFRDLIARTGAISFYRPGTHLLQEALHHPGSVLPGVNIAAAEFLPQLTVKPAQRLTNLRLLDLHDHPVLQAEAIGMPLADSERRQQERLVSANLDAFERIVVVSESFGDLAGVPANRRVTIPNGTDTVAVRPGSWPSRPSIALISGAAPGRGIETLIEAVRLLRGAVAGVKLSLGLTATGTASAAYMASLKRDSASDEWIQIRSVPYLDVGEYLASATVLAIPHPANAYMDSALPVKLFDCMAAGRPLVVTPRKETARVVRAADAGIVASSDDPRDLAESLRRCLEDQSRAREMGSNGRRAAVELYDWRRLSRQLADFVLAS